MKRNLIVLSILLLSVSFAHAQFGVQVAGTAANMLWDNSTLYTINTKIKPGAQIGLTYDIPLANKMVINTGLNYKHAGTWIRDNKDVAAMRLNYINLDVTYNYIFNIANLEIYAEGGGYAGYAISGKIKYRLENADDYEETLSIGTSEIDDDIKPIDGGLTIGAGIYFGSFKFGIGYMHGLVNISTQDDQTMRNRNGYLRVAYLFGRE